MMVNCSRLPAVLASCSASPSEILIVTVCFLASETWSGQDQLHEATTTHLADETEEVSEDAEVCELTREDLSHASNASSCSCSVPAGK